MAEDNNKGKEVIISIEQAKEIINKLQRSSDKNFHESMLAKARIYDLFYKGEKEPIEAELKAQIVYLDKELKKVIEQRDHYKFEIARYKLKEVVNTKEEGKDATK